MRWFECRRGFVALGDVHVIWWGWRLGWRWVLAWRRHYPRRAGCMFVTYAIGPIEVRVWKA